MLNNTKWEENNEIGRVLLKAADLIEEKGLAKHQRLDKNGSMCIHGAVAFVLMRHPQPVSESERESETTVTTHLSKFLETNRGLDPKREFCRNSDGTHYECASWNNDPRRTKAEVVSALREAAVWQPEFEPA